MVFEYAHDNNGNARYEIMKHPVPLFFVVRARVTHLKARPRVSIRCQNYDRSLDPSVIRQVVNNACLQTKIS